MNRLLPQSSRETVSLALRTLLSLLDRCRVAEWSLLVPRSILHVFAQHALRMIAFGDIYKVLSMEPFPQAADPPGQRKRPWANGASAGGLQPN